MTEQEMWSELHSILATMLVPPDRFSDQDWLRRNLGIPEQNRFHPYFSRAHELVYLIGKAQVKAESASG